MTPANPSSPPAPLYSERLAAPPSYWAIALFFGLSFVTAVGVYLGPEGALAAALVTAGLIAGVLAWIGGARIAVDDRGLTVGAALLEWPYLGDVVRLGCLVRLEAADQAIEEPWRLRLTFGRYPRVEIDVVSSAGH